MFNICEINKLAFRQCDLTQANYVGKCEKICIYFQKIKIIM